MMGRLLHRYAAAPSVMRYFAQASGFHSRKIVRTLSIIGLRGKMCRLARHHKPAPINSDLMRAPRRTEAETDTFDRLREALGQVFSPRVVLADRTAQAILADLSRCGDPEEIDALFTRLNARLCEIHHLVLDQKQQLSFRSPPRNRKRTRLQL